MIHIYYIFSEWILILALLYYFNLIPYNPIYLVYLALIINTLLFVYILYLNYNNKIKKEVVYKMMLVIFIEKLIPLYLIYNKPINHDDLYFSIFIIILYVIFMELMNKNFIELYQYISESIINNKNVTPVFVLYDYISKFNK